MDLLQLKYFQTVARLEHMTKAARQLSIAQPSLSQTIARLEEELGVPLFDRKGREIRLNQFGTVFLRRVERIFGELEDARHEIADLAGMEHGRIALAVVIPQILPDLLRSFLAEHPHVSFHLFHQHSSETVQQQLEQGEIDLCITSPPIEQAGIGWTSLMKEEIYLMVPPNHRLANRTSIHLREVEHEPFVSLKPGSTMRDLTDNCCRQAGFVPRVAFEGDEPSTLRGLVTAGLGVAFISELVLRTVVDPAAIVPLRIEEPRCDRIIGLAWRKEHYLSQAAQYFRDFVIQYFKNIEE
ncbi:LysR family transcriptional regulator [Reticulibacter mediterranei]|uniref:LysR family transcriptional regulator n=1 Tax=Reticulibacter mediterranei TaxID=2778369 RepID=A0A8J3IST0_9CHLR|nr:LysR family transcriptional regulator [Reticulibacter mediterranei]GHO97933.1 LysR family transcriptional regulator [Reticulibacter mediterranei]